MVTVSEILGQRFLDQNTLTEGNYAEGEYEYIWIHPLGITITEMQKLFCHKIENVSISRFLCVILLSLLCYFLHLHACML